MQYFTIQAESHREAVDKMKRQYGDGAKIINYRNIRLGGFLGIFSREGIEITGYVSNSVLRKRNVELQNEKQKILENVKKEQTLDLLLKEIQTLKKSLQNSSGSLTGEHPNLSKLSDLLRFNDFSREYSDELLERIRHGFSLEDLKHFQSVQEKVINWIGEGISIYPALQFAENEPKICILVGPTGVGKTTTIAKIAAIYGIGTDALPRRKVRIVTIDNYRIAARQQIKTYGEIMQIPVSFVETAIDLKKAVALYQDVDLILVDTIGKNPKDYTKLGEMKNLLDACGQQGESHLAVSATTKTCDIEEIFQQFEPFNYRSVVLTKLDETSRIGNVLSVLHKKRKPLSYITDGQAVPQDIEAASVIRLLMNLEGFRVNRELLEEKFGKNRSNFQSNLESNPQGDLKGIWRE